MENSMEYATNNQTAMKSTTKNDILNKHRNENGVNLKSGPIRLYSKKRKNDGEIDKRKIDEKSKKARLDDLVNEMKKLWTAMEKQMKMTKNGESSSPFTKSPDYIKGLMRNYQVQGLNWMIALYELGLSGILGDEMGLGKTLQTISLIGYLQLVKKVDGRFLVVVPLVTLINWQNEFKQWCPALKVVTVYGNVHVRCETIRTELKVQPYNWDVCLTTYETCKMKFSKHAFSAIHWHHIILDEGTRIKDENTMLTHVIGLYKSKNRVILTGTPLNNNLHELWTLLNFLMPDMLKSSEDFDDWFDDLDCLAKKGTVVKDLHSILRPILLRRLKSEVEKDIKPKKEISLYVDITDCQRQYYKKILTRNIEIITGDGSTRVTRLNTLFVQLQKCTNHPYLFPGAEKGPPYANGEHIVNNAGKMIVLDKLLTKLKQRESRVLIFSQMTRVLDVIDDYLHLRGYEYCRLDGSTNIDDRTQSVAEFQKPKSKKFIFLLSTRAGGLGINLTAADVVIIYDSDWNPQMDLQAIARAHRIGQTKEVLVFRIIAKNTVDEKMMERTNLKLKLDDIVIQSQVKKSVRKFQVEEEQEHGIMLNAVRFGADLILSNDLNYNGVERDKLIHENAQKLIDQIFENL